MVTTKRLDKFQMDFGQVDKFCLWARGEEWEMGWGKTTYLLVFALEHLG